MMIDGRCDPQQVLQQHMNMRGLYQVLTADDVGDPLMGIINDAGQMIGGIAFAPQNNFTNSILKFGQRYGFLGLIRERYI